MIVIPFDPAHIDRLELQGAQPWIGEMRDPGYARALKDAGPCYTAIDGDRIVACAGLVNVWENRAHAWALIAHDAGRNFVAMFRAMQRFLDLQDTRRIEATVDAGFEQGHRMIRMLGFTLETPEPMRAYTPDGRDCHLYARVR